MKEIKETAGETARLFVKQIKIGPYYIYVSNRRLRPRSSRGYSLQKAGDAKRLKKIKAELYGSLYGRCSQCGEWHSPQEMELHHIIPVEKAPDLMLSYSNLLLVCKSCHDRLHGRGVGGVVVDASGVSCDRIAAEETGRDV